MNFIRIVGWEKCVCVEDGSSRIFILNMEFVHFKKPEL